MTSSSVSVAVAAAESGGTTSIMGAEPADQLPERPGVYGC
jgi:hypothetical protein